MPLAPILAAILAAASVMPAAAQNRLDLADPAAFAAADRDGDRLIDRREYLSIPADRRGDSGFEALDANADNLLNRTELRMGRRGTLAPPDRPPPRPPLA